jgi:hypothetical protein
MPDADGFPTADELINGGKKPKPPELLLGHPVTEVKSSQVPMPIMDERQEKAMRLILSGLPFVLVVIRPTKPEGEKYVPCKPEEATGADFFTVIRGDKDTLLGSKHNLPDVIDRGYNREGLL